MRRSGLNRFTARTADHVFLSLLWLLACVPVVTAPIATAALLEVARQRDRGDEPALAGAFLAAARQYARPALTLGYGWVALGGFLALDLMIVNRTDLAGRAALLVALLALAILYALISVALFPVLVSFEARPVDQLRTAAAVAMLHPLRGLLALAVVGTAGAAAWAAPLAALVLPSLTATALLRVYHGAFIQLPSSTPGPSPTPTPAISLSKEHSR